jgi:5-methylcytosine-specific restriction endonuclease McrA
VHDRGGQRRQVRACGGRGVQPGVVCTFRSGQAHAKTADAGSSVLLRPAAAPTVNTLVRRYLSTGEITPAETEGSMPRAPRQCTHSGCTALVRSGRRCAEHASQSWQGTRTQSSAITSTARWKALRTSVLRRDKCRCRLAYDGCTHHADQVDHVLGTAAGGSPYDPSNCVASCRSCNARKASAEGAAARRAIKARRPKPVHPGLLR